MNFSEMFGRGISWAGQITVCTNLCLFVPLFCYRGL